MQLIISILFSLFLYLTSNLDFHKFYVSTTNIVYKSEKKSILNPSNMKPCPKAGGGGGARWQGGGDG